MRPMLNTLRCYLSTVLVLCFAGAMLFEPDSVQADPPAGEYWRLTFEDEFEGTDLDTEVWDVEAGTPGHILSSRWPENVVVENGLCRLLTKKENRGGMEWTSGHIWTKVFQQRYGYWEARFRYGAASGLNNAFWNIAPGDFEIDINEGHYPGTINTNLHDHTRGTAIGQPYHTGLDLSANFHTYAVHWTPTTLTYYFDGTAHRMLAHTICHREVAIRLSTAVLHWAGDITDDLDGTSMDIDWVRIYEAAEHWTADTISWDALALGAQKHVYIVVVNESGQTVHFTAAPEIAGMEAGDFSIDPCDLSPLAPGAQRYFKVNFAPQDIGHRYAQLHFYTDYPGLSHQIVTLHGQGIDGVIYVAPDGDDDNDGLGWETPLATPLAAVRRTLAVDAHSVWCRAGSYQLNGQLIIHAGLNLYGGFAGTETHPRQRSDIHGENETVLQQTVSGDRVLGLTDGSDVIIDGLTLTGATNATWGGAGLRLYRCDDTVIVNDCYIHTNTDDPANGKGAGICIVGSSDTPSTPIIRNCVIENNTNQGPGGGGGVIFSSYSGGVLENCVIVHNTTLSDHGGGVYVAANADETVAIKNCTIAYNDTQVDGGGIYNQRSGLAVRNCILWANGYDQIENAAASIDVSYSCLLGGWTGTGNISTDPRFASGLDFHLRSQAGRYKPSDGAWVLDTSTSACIDAGCPNDAWASEPAGNGRRINMGAYGGTIWASKTQACAAALSGDFDHDGMVDYHDHDLLVSTWLDRGLEQTTWRGELLAHWTFDETDGVVAHDAIGGFDGALSGGQWSADGVWGGCLYFDGASSVSVNNADQLFGQVGDEISLVVWVKGDDSPLPREDCLFYGSDVNQQGHNPMVYCPTSTGRIRFDMGHVAAQEPGWPSYYWGWDMLEWSGTTPSDWHGQWVHYAFVKSATHGVMRVYRAGELVAQSLGATAPMAGTQYFTIGALKRPTYETLHYHGKMDDLRIYDVALTEAEIKRLWQTGMVQEIEASAAVMPADIDVNGTVDLLDWALLATNWLTPCTTP